MKSIFKVILLSFILAFAFTACENPIGLGTKVNTEKPVIKNAGDDNQPGDFLQGDGNKIWLDVEQEFGIAKVFMEVEYNDIETGEKSRKIIDAYYDDVQQKWCVELDTSGMEDGTIKAWVTAIDVDGNKTTTTDIVYFIKNTPPQIKLNMPLVEGDNFDDDIFLDNLKDIDPLFLGFELLGLATDNYGIEQGYPKIMIWPSELTDVGADGIPLPSNGQYGTWRSLIVPNSRPGLTATKFSWPMQRLISDPGAPGGWRLPQGEDPRVSLLQGKYRIRIVTKDLFGNENYYPDRKDNARGPGGQALNPNDINRKYIEINYIASAIPIAQVTTSPAYYNGASNFEVKFLVSCSNPLAETNPVEVYITDGNDGNEKCIGGPYYPPQGSLISPYNFTFNITAEQASAWDNPKEGTLFVRLIPRDKEEKNGPPTYQHFQYDITPPKVPIDRPVSLSNKKKEGDLTGGSYEILYPSMDSTKWVTGSVTVGGINTDDNGIKDVFYHIGKIGAGDDSAELAASSTFYDGVSWIDTKLNTSSPQAGWGGSVYAWTYTANFPIGYKASNLSIIQELSDLSGYSSPNADTDGKERFYLPFYVKVADNAGNYHVVHYKLCIDPLLDEPQVTITYPQEGNLVGGTVRLSGYAVDNYWMHTVLIRVKKAGALDYYIPTNPPTSLFYSDPAYYSYPKPNGNDSDGWFKANKTGDDATINWSYSINQDKLLNPDNPDVPQEVIIEVVAIDTNEISHQTPHITGPISKLIVYFSSKVPTIEDVEIIKSTAEPLSPAGTKTSGRFEISMAISAVGGFNNVQARINNTTPDYNIITSGTPQPGGSIWTLSSPEVNGERRDATLKFTVDSTNGGLIPAVPYGQTGNMVLELTVEDNTEQHFSTTGTWNIGIDNFYPTAKIETSRIAYENAPEKYFFVEGTAQDWGAGSGNIQGLERVLVYFERAKITYPSYVRTVEGTGTYLMPTTGGTVVPADFITYPNVMDKTIPGSESLQAPNVANFTTFPKFELDGGVYKSNAAMVIDYAENDPEQDYDGDGTKGEMWNGLLDKAWGARMETTKFSDGPYIAHYIIMDQAGNATHYQKDIFIENKKPKITQINIGTDINFDNSIENWTSKETPGEYRQDAYIVDLSSYGRGAIVTPAANFKIRNNMFGLRLTLEGGNGQKTVIAGHVTRSGSPISVTNMERGRVYEIAATAPDTNFTKYGAPNNYEKTFFVASGEGEGAGTVYQYTTVSTSSTQDFTNLGIGNTTQTILFNKFYPDVTDGDDKLFVIKVYDSALSSPLHGNPTEYDQLAHALLLTVAVSNTDTEAPSITAADFGQKYVTSAIGNPTNDAEKTLQDLTASEYTFNVAVDAADKKLGYVQYAKDSSPNTTANISGRVIFTGKAADNHRIQNITAQIQGYPNAGAGTEFDIAVWSAGKLIPATGSADWEFKVDLPSDVPQLTLEYGHALNWQFIWDSSKHSSVAANNQLVTFRVYDHASPKHTAVSTKTVNIVPYISEITTPLSGAYASAPSAFNRSALGGYPVRESNAITIKGFNMGTAVGNAAINGTELSGGSNDGTTITSTVPPAALSGPLVVTVNGIVSFNNSASKNKTAAYNQEKNGVNNNVLDNSRYMYVWNTGYIDDETVSTVYNPFMRLDNSGNRFLSYGYYPSSGNGVLRVRRNNTNIATATANTNRMTNTTVATGRANNSWYAMGSDITAGNYPFKFSMSTSAGTYQTSIDIVPIIGANSNRFKIPRIAVLPTNGTTNRSDANSDRILMGYFDGTNNQINIIYGNVGNNSNYQGIPGTPTVVAADSTTHKGSMYTAVGFLSNGLPLIAWYDSANQNLVFSWGNGTPTTNNVNSRNFTTTANAANSGDGNSARVFTYNGHGLNTNDVVTVGGETRYVYRLTNNTFKLFSNATLATGNPATGTAGNVTVVVPVPVTTSYVPTSQSQWQGNAAIIDSGGRGAHVDMAVDGNDNVHLAYYDVANGGLYYAYIPYNTGEGKPSITKTVDNKAANITPVKVDTFLSAGTKLMINVRSDGTRYVPYITYAHASFAETRNSIRVAWRTDFTTAAPLAGADINDSFTGKWEVMTVPVTNTVTPMTDEFVCNGVTTNATWTAPGGTSDLNYNTNLNQTIVVGYMTDKWYEGAILKGDIRSVPTILQK